MVFVLATTEAHKVPATIVDRCHRFDFHRPSLEQIAERAARVAAEEEIEIPDPAVGDDRPLRHRQLPRRARHARAARDLRRHSEVKLEDVLEILGVADAELVLDAAEALADRDREGRAADRRSACRTRAATSPSSCATWPAHLRHLFVVQTLGRGAGLVLGHGRAHRSPGSRRPSASPRARSCGRSTSSRPRSRAVKDGSEPRIQLEMALLKATQPQADLLAAGADGPRIEQRRQSAPARPEPQTPPEAAPQPERRTEPEAAAPSPRGGGNASRARRSARRAAATASVASTGGESEPESQPQPDPAAAPTLDLEQLRTLWPTVVETVRTRRTGWSAPRWPRRAPHRARGASA